jgi:hypothetical protein
VGKEGVKNQGKKMALRKLTTIWGTIFTKSPKLALRLRPGGHWPTH